MTQTPPTNPELDAAKAIARAAWEHIRPYYKGEYAVTEKPDGPATDADLAANAFIVGALSERFPNDGMLSEESEDNEERLTCERVWIVDPIDGTKDFIEGTDDFAIHIGLVERAGEEYLPQLGVVYQPVGDLLHFACRDQGAWVEDGQGKVERLRVSTVSERSEMTAVITRSHRTERFLVLMDRLGPRKTVTMGSMGKKMMQVARGAAEFYLNNARGMCKEWDIAPPAVIVEEAGGTVTDLRGRPLAYNRKDPRNHDGLLVSNGPNHESLRRDVLRIEQELRNA